MENPNNPIRAQRAKTAVHAFVAACGEHFNGSVPECVAENVSDLLCNLMHLCDVEGIDFARALSSAQTNHEAEVEIDDIEESFIEGGGLVSGVGGR